ncbi:MAG TPA: bifunctional nuclease family protein [Limnochordia bacterium]
MVKMKVKVVGLEQSTMHPMVIITDYDEKGYIPILIGPTEADAIRRGLAGEKVARPFTHELVKGILDAVGVRIDRVVIHDLRDEVYFARIYLKTKNGEVDIDARPSDSIALAVRTGAPIYVTDEVAARAVIENRPYDDKELEDFRRFLEEVTPEDFVRNFRAGNQENTKAGD